MKTNVVIAFLIAIIFLIFSFQNSEATTVNFLIWSFSTSRVLIILGSFFIGLLCGLLIVFKQKPKNK